MRDASLHALDELHDEQERADEEWRRRYERRLREHPHCLDPEHPGCKACVEDWSDE